MFIYVYIYHLWGKCIVEAMAHDSFHTKGIHVYTDIKRERLNTLTITQLGCE